MDEHPVTTLLVVRTMADLPVTIAAVNALRSARRARTHHPHRERLLGVLRKGDLEVGLPPWPDVRGTSLADRAWPDDAGESRDRARWGIRESSSLSGVWAYCWVDGPLVTGARDTASARRAILLALSDVRPARGRSHEQDAFLAVFDTDEPDAAAEREVLALRDRHPHLVSAQWLRDDPILGLRTLH